MSSGASDATQERADDVLNRLVSSVIRDKDEDGKSRLLWWAVFKGRKELVKELIQSKTDVDKEWDGWVNVSEQYINILSDRAKGNMSCRKTKLTPISTAAALGFHETVRLLVDADADVDAPGYLSTHMNALWMAARNGHKQVVECLLEARAATGPPDGVTHTALHSAVCNGYQRIVELLINAGADVDALDVYGKSSLNYASSKGHREVVDLLIKAGADIDAKDSQGRTALFMASCYGHKEIIAVLIKYGANIDVASILGRSALFMATANGHKDIVELLINAGADTEVRTDLVDISALHVAAMNGHKEVVELLINTGADIKAKCKGNLSVLFAASQMGHSEVVKLLISVGADIDTVNEMGLSALHTASQTGHKETAEILINAGVDIDAKSNKKETALYFASGMGNKELVEILVSCGANVSTEDDRNISPLTVASFFGHKDVVELLLGCGVDIEDRDITGESALIKASWSGSVEVVKLLCDAGADTEVRNNEGVSALLIASSHGHKEIVEYLLSLGVHIESKDNECKSALWVASYKGHNAIVQLLLNAGANIETRDTTGISVLTIAASNGHREDVECLLNAGADTATENGFGQSALYLACRNGHKDVVELLVSVDPMWMSKVNECLCVAIQCGHKDVVEFLIDAGADINAMSDVLTISKNEYEETIKRMTRCGLKIKSTSDVIEPSTPNRFNILFTAVSNNHEDLVKYLLDQGAGSDLDPPCMSSLLLFAVCNNNVENLQLLVKYFVRNRIGINFDSMVIYSSTVSMYRTVMLLAAWYGLRVTTNHLLPLQDVIDYNFLDNFSLNVLKGNPTHSRLDVSALIKCPGLGYVACIPLDKAGTIFRYTNSVIVELTERFIAHRCKVETDGCGSVAEGTCVGLPDEVDYLFKFSSTVAAVDLKWLCHGYVICDRNSSYRLSPTCTQSYMPFELICHGSKWFHDEFFHGMALGNEDGPILVDTLPMVKNGGHASTEISVKWVEPETARCFPVSVDLVPVVHFKDAWLDNFIDRTWMMDKDTLSSWGFCLVAKPPHKKSSLGQSMDEVDRVKLWRLSFSHLETEHFISLDTRVKDAYVAAKCLRNPDVCRILLYDDDEILRPVDRYITSYMLKTVFLHNVEDFLASRQKLIEMVYIVYSELESYLDLGFLPFFWQPDVNVLEGLSIDIKKSLQVARLMKVLVDCLRSHSNRHDRSPAGYYYHTLH